MATDSAAPSRFAKLGDQRELAVALFNAVWDLLELDDRTADEDERMLHMAHASRYHWGQVGAPVNLVRGEWQCSRVYAMLDRAEPCLHHARRVLGLCQRHCISDFDLGYAYEALARAYAVAGDAAAARSYIEQALTAAEDVAIDEDRSQLLAELETIPGQSRFW